MKKTTVTSLILLLLFVTNSFSQNSGRSCDTYFGMNILQCDIYISPSGQSWYTSGAYSDTLSNAAGCDSIILFIVSIFPSTSSNIDIWRCNSFVTSTGKNFSITGTYLDTISNAIGCDSVITYNFTSGYHSKEIQEVTACNQWVSPNGKTHTNSGLFNDTITGINGCDTLIPFNITIYTPEFDTIDAFHCFLYTSVTRKQFTSSGTYYDTVIGANLCLKYITYHIIIGVTYQKVPLQVYCDSIVTNKGKVFKTTGIHYDTTTYLSSCDTIYEYNVKIGSFYDTIKFTSCFNYVSPSGDSIKTSGIYYDTLQGKRNCDSIRYYLDITVGNTKDTISVFSCGRFYSPSTSNSWISSGIYLDKKFISALYCDSSVYYKIEIGNSYTSDTINRCLSYTLPGTGKVITQSGIYLDTFPISLGCDSITTLRVEINFADTRVTKYPGELVASVSGANYQWLDCNNSFSPVAGANSKIFLPTILGPYALEVRNFGCIDTSACFDVDSYASIDENEKLNLTVYPNPVSDVLIIELNETPTNTSVLILDITGKEVYRSDYMNQNSISINMNGIDKGIYILKVFNEEKEKSIRIVKQ